MIDVDKLLKDLWNVRRVARDAELAVDGMRTWINELQASKAEIDALEFVVVEGRIASVMDYGILRQWLVRLRPEFDRPEPAERTPAPHATPVEGTSQSECTEPLAWAVEDSSGVFAVDLSFSEMDRRRERASFKSPCSIVPLYRSPALTDAEREAVAYYVGTGGPGEVDSTLQGLLERTK